VLTDPTGASFKECGDEPCEGGSGEDFGFWTMDDVQNYLDAHEVPDSVAEDCYDNPMVCPSVLRWNGYDPFDATTGEGDFCSCPMDDPGTGSGTTVTREPTVTSSGGATSINVESDIAPASVRTVGQQIDNLPPTGQEPNSIYRQFSDQGLRKVGIYDSNGNLVKRIDVTGPPHNEVPTPHVVENINWRPEPRAPTGWYWKPVFRGPTNDWENSLIRWLSELVD